MLQAGPRQGSVHPPDNGVWVREPTDEDNLTTTNELAPPEQTPRTNSPPTTPTVKVSGRPGSDKIDREVTRPSEQGIREDTARVTKSRESQWTQARAPRAHVNNAENTPATGAQRDRGEDGPTGERGK